MKDCRLIFFSDISKKNPTSVHFLSKYRLLTLKLGSCTTWGASFFRRFWEVPNVWDSKGVTFIFWFMVIFLGLDFFCPIFFWFAQHLEVYSFVFFFVFFWDVYRTISFLDDCRVKKNQVS